MNIRPRIPLVFLAILIASACGTTQRSKLAPQVSVSADREPYFGSNTEAPLDLGINITNRAPDPIRVRSIRITSPGGVQWAIRPLYRIFNEVIAPGETKSLLMPAIAVAATTRLTPTEPMTVRVDLVYELQGKELREIYNFNRIVFD